MKIRLLAFCLLSITLITCNDDSPPAISMEAENFINEILDIMEGNSINRNTIDWPEFRANVYEKIVGAQTIVDTYPGIREALIRLADNHSSFVKPDGSNIFVGTLQCNALAVVNPTFPADIGYVKVNSFSGSGTAAATFAEGIQDQIRNQDHADIKGWIVDLRGNGGGNMWPMLAGIGPILGEGISGYFIDPDGQESSWSFQNGASYVNGSLVTGVSDSYELIASDPKVAVLLDNAIASSGEVIAISFIGRPNTKSFGSATCGLSTGNAVFNLSNNARLNLTTVYLADRNKNKYGVPVNPDQVSSNETIIQEAVAWIEN